MFSVEQIIMTKALLFIISITVCNIFVTYVDTELTNVIQTDKGPVQGEILKTVRRSIAFSSFRGIPYGKPPIGYSRFRAPDEAESWRETYQATSEATPCPQMDYFVSKNFIGDEDCLNLNVYTPKIDFSVINNKNNLLPVMVWIYGGAFKNGYTNMTYYGPDFLIENHVVVVAMNYRLGVLGFLSLNLPNATGNAGLKDQLLALKWVQRNIKAFGGDPNSVTIFGQSAGAISVDFHILSDQSKGLFHRSISMSGSPLCNWAFSTSSYAEIKAFHVGRILEINTIDKTELLEALYEQTAEDLVRATQKIISLNPPFKPTLENKKIAGNSAFLTECSIHKYRSGNFSKLPFMGGFMDNEILGFLAALKLSKELSLDLLKQIELSASLDLTPLFPNLLQSIDIPVQNLTDEDVLHGVMDEITELLFISEIDLKTRMLANYSSAPVYYYRNFFAPIESTHKILKGLDKIGAAHGDDLAYCWHIAVQDFPTDPENPIVIMQERIPRMWTNFAKYSNPTPLGAHDPILNIVWPVSGPNGIYLKIDQNFLVDVNPINPRTKLIQQALDKVLPDITQCSGVGNDIILTSCSVDRDTYIRFFLVIVIINILGQRILFIT